MPFEVKRTPFCSFLASDQYFYPELAKASNFPVDIIKNCPLQVNKVAFEV
jgi:hypothetical protein